MIGTKTRSLRWHLAGAAAVIAAPVLLLPSPFAFRPIDPMQAVAVGSARDAVAESRNDRWGLARALIAPFQKAETSVGNAARPATVTAPAVNNGLLAYAAPQTAADPVSMLDPGKELGIDIGALREGVEAYRRGDAAAGDAVAARATNPLVTAVLEWVWLRTHPVEAGPGRITKFLADHPDWPGAEWLRRRVEDAFYASRIAPAKVRAWFVGSEPLSALGRIALARAIKDGGDVDGAATLLRTVWAKDDFSPFAETQFRKQFGDLIGPAAHKARADRLMYKEKSEEALRVATLSGDKDLLALMKVRAAAHDGPLPDKLIATIPAKYANDAGLRFAKIQIARRANKIDEATDLMLGAPRDLASIVDGDEWWTERRLIARKLLDANEPAKAYQICAQHSATSNESRIEAEFHAGWVSLRFLNDAARAKTHFATVASLAQTPMSRARAAYWQGRAAEAAGEPSNVFYETAATYSATFYGQLAAAKNGVKPIPPAAPAVAEGNGRAVSVRAVDALYLAGAKDLAVSLATDVARNLRDSAQLRAMARIVARDRDARVSLAVGKLASQRGTPLDDLAFPTYGIPNFSPLPNSAELPLVYAIARQESAFDPNAMSGAGAMGLMQMIASTAKRTAQRAGLAFDALRMRSEPAFNAQLGAAHLGELLGEHGGSTILTMVAYNAGGRRANEWVKAYGDPRKAGTDVVDWIERIPFTETRNYVQRVSENLTVYRARFAAPVKPAAATPTDARSVPVATSEPSAAPVTLTQRITTN